MWSVTALCLSTRIMVGFLDSLWCCYAVISKSNVRIGSLLSLAEGRLLKGGFCSLVLMLGFGVKCAEAKIFKALKILALLDHARKCEGYQECSCCACAQSQIRLVQVYPLGPR